MTGKYPPVCYFCGLNSQKILMKNKLPLILVSAALLTSCSQAPDSDQAKVSDAQEVAANTGGNSYKVDPSASKVEWVGTKVSGYHSGEVKISGGEVTVDNGNVTGGNFTMDMTSINTTGPEGSDAESNGKLTGHLKSPDFFDVENHKEAKFEITEVTPFSGTVAEEDNTRQEDISEYKVSDPTHTVSGNLTIKGVTKNISFPAKITTTDGSIDAIAKFNIDRSQWNITYPGKPDDLIRNDIHLGIAIKAVK